MWQLLARSIVLLICCVSASFSTYADENLYQVELIIFEHTNPKRFNTEHWPKFVGKLDPASAIDINDPEAIQPVGEFVTLVGSKQMILNSEANKIKATPTTRFIKHVAYQQFMYLNEKSKAIYLTAGNDQEVAALLTIKPVRNAFNLDLDLIYKLQPNEKNLAPGVDELRITRSVKFKKKEVYYIDHPVIGILITIVPVVTTANN